MINTDLSINAVWVARYSSENGFTLTFTSSGAFNISSYTFTLNIRRIGSDTNSLQLTQGSGITNGGASGILTVILSESQLSTINLSSYFYELSYVFSGKTYALLNGILELYNQSNLLSNPEPEFTTVVRLGANQVTLSYAA